MEIYDCKLLYQKLLRRCEKELSLVSDRIENPVSIGILTVTTDEQNVAFASKVASISSGLGLKVEEERIAVRNVGRKFLPLLREWSESDKIHGILLLYNPDETMPPLHEVYAILPWQKDAGGEHFHNVGHFCIESQPHRGYPRPAEATAVVEIIKHYQIQVKRRNVVIIGEGHRFERILMQKLSNMGCDVTFVHPDEIAPGIHGSGGPKGKRKTQLLNPRGEIVISCVNKPGYLSKTRLNRHSTVIDNGYTFFRGRIGGDVDFNSTQNWARAITPVPGGVKTIAQVITLLNFANLVKLNSGFFDSEEEKALLQRRFSKPDSKAEANQ